MPSLCKGRPRKFPPAPPLRLFPGTSPRVFWTIDDGPFLSIVVTFSQELSQAITRAVQSRPDGADSAAGGLGNLPIIQTLLVA